MITHRSCLVPVLVAALTGAARADFNGFGDFSQFTINQGDNASAPTLGEGWIRMTSNTDEQRRSIFHNTTQDVTRFSASFTIRSIGDSNVSTIGACLVFQNSAAGARALGGSGLGYSGITRSVGASLEMGRYGFNGSGLYRDGITAGGASDVAPLNFLSGHEFEVRFDYAGSILRTSIMDRATGQQFRSASFIDIESIVGGPRAYVGITAGTGVWTSASHYISDFRYAVPTPGAASVLLASGMMAARRRRRAVV